MARLPDGRFHLRSSGQEVALPPALAAQAVGLPLADFESRMAQATQATQAALAAPRPAAGTPGAAPPIWQGRARHGDYAEVLSRNPDGTFQIRVDGKELTRTERDVAYMTGLTKAPLYAMLAKATEGRMESSHLPNQEHNSMAGRLPEGDASSRNSLIDQATRSMEAILPGVMGRDAHILNHANDLLNSDYATRRRPPFTADEIATIRDSEGFHDPVTGQSFTFASQVQPKPGESAAQALMRVTLHESLGHGGVNRLLANNPQAQQQFDFLVGKIMELDPQGFQALAADPAYAHLKGDIRALALEWLAQKSETRPDLLSKPNVLTHLRNVLGQAISALQVRLGLRAETGADLDRRVDIFLFRARQAAVKGGAITSTEGLQFRRGSEQPAAARPVARMAARPAAPRAGATANPPASRAGAATKPVAPSAGAAANVGHSFTGARERAAFDRMVASFGGPTGPLMQQVQRIAADKRRFGPDVAEGILQSLVVAMQDPNMRTARARDVVLRPLQNSARLSKCIGGLALAVKSGLTPAEIADVLSNHSKILSPHYTAENLLLDTEILGPIPGVSDLWRMLKTNSAQAKGFRYELEGAAAINRGAMGDDAKVIELSKRIRVSLHGGQSKTDIDVVVKQGRDTIIYNQLKRSAKAVGYGERGLEATKLWVAKALADLAKHKSHRVVYVVPPGVKVPPRIEAWLKSVRIDIVRIIHAK